MPASRASASSSSCAIGSSETLPLVITSGSPASAAAGGAAASTAAGTPRSALRGATEAATGASDLRGASTIGRSRPGQQRRLLRPSARPARRPRPRRAPSRRTACPRGCLRARSAATAVSFAARHGKVVAADALDRHDPPLAQRGDRTAQRLVAVVLAGQQPQRRPALRARVGLGVEAPVGRVLVLRPRSACTARSRPSWSAAGRTGRRARS
jgi:hypothetical protein